MPFFRKYDVSYSEREMQINVVESIRGMDHPFKPHIIEEFHISAIGRRSDIIVKIGFSHINIECKLTDIAKVIQQAIDHARWAKYSYICIPSTTYVAHNDYIKIVEKRLGLLMYHHETKNVIEAIPAMMNKSSVLAKSIRSDVNLAITTLRELDNQLILKYGDG